MSWVMNNVKPPTPLASVSKGSGVGCASLSMSISAIDVPILA